MRGGPAETHQACLHVLASTSGLLLPSRSHPVQALESLDPSKYSIPDPFPYQEARQLFKGGFVAPPSVVMFSGCMSCDSKALAMHATGQMPRLCFILNLPSRMIHCSPTAEPDVLRGEAIPAIKWSAPDKGAQHAP